MPINISVAYATPQEQIEVALVLEDVITVAEAIQQSNLLKTFPEIPYPDIKVGVFSREVNLDTVVIDGDRIEIYRPLIMDPKEARRLRVNG